MPGKYILIVSPAAASANNGNAHTARRWSQFLDGRHKVAIAPGWDHANRAPDLLIALHARRSAAPLAAFALAHPERARVLVLTGTDLYRDIATDPSAQASLHHASMLVLLQSAGLTQLDPALHPKCRVIYQSAPQLPAAPNEPGRRHDQICMIGHLRAEKDPLTFMRAAELVQHPRARMVHIGGALEPALADAATSASEQSVRYRWLGALPHAATRQHLRRSHAMVIASLMEGGANVIVEALTCAVPVLASDISGNRGMLGDDYAGYFPVGDAAALAQLIERSIAEPAFYALLRAQCAARAQLFTPAAEQAAVRDLVDNLLLTHPASTA